MHVEFVIEGVVAFHSSRGVLVEVALFRIANKPRKPLKSWSMLDTYQKHLHT